MAGFIITTKLREKLVAEGVTDTTATVNPIMFVASTAFILGLGLFLIRIYPYIIRLLARIGRRVWSPAQYVSLTNIGRSSTGRERFFDAVPCSYCIIGRVLLPIPQEP